MLPLVDVTCPYCGETITLAVDDSAGDQSYVEDCHVCCRPIEVHVAGEGGSPAVKVRAEDDA